MALGATVYKATIDVSDLDRDSYGNYVLTIARHPSETEERLMLRVLAFCRLAGERLEFGRGLSTEGEPALWELDDTGAIVQWVELGCPDVKQVRKAAGRSEHVQIVAYGEDRVGPWWDSNKGDFAKIGKLTVVSVSDEQVTALAAMASRNMKLAVTIQDGILWISDDRDSLQVEVMILQTEHERYSDF